MGWKDKVASKVWGAIKPTIKPRIKPDKSELDLLKSESKVVTHKAKMVDKPLAAVSGYSVPAGHFANGYTNGGDRVNFKVGGRVALKEGSKKNWMQDVNKSIEKRGTKGKCTPITKKGCTGRAKALAKTFKKMAKKRG